MQYAITSVVAMSFAILFAPVYAESVPEWVKNTAEWWAQDLISDTEFLGAVQYLVESGIIVVEATEAEESDATSEVPDWVKNTAEWWAQDLISDTEFLGAVQYLVNAGLIAIESEDPVLAEMQAELEACEQFKKASQRSDCKKEVEERITIYRYQQEAEYYKIGPVAYYYPGALLDVTEGGQPILTIQMLVINEGTDNVTLMCSGPSVCNYDVTDGTNVYKYAATDFTSGSITVKPEQAREFEMIFGPNIGYGGTTFEYDPAKQYHFRINEGFGSGSIPLNLN